MEEVLQNLVNLQYIDSRIDDIARLRGDLPEEIADIEMDLARLEGKLRGLRQEEINLKKELHILDGDIAEAKALVDKYEKQQMSVRNNREYDALTKEIESQKQRISNALSRLDEIEIILEDVIRAEEDTRIQVEDIQDVLIRKQEELTLLKKRTKDEEDALLDKRDEACKQLGDRYLRNYERLRTGYKNGLVVVPMISGACMGMMLPAQIQVDVRKRNKIIVDENTGRIVVDQSFFEKAEREFKL
jgi:predicted  nucleic acid-binding Zn-ribbon protein